MSSFPALPQPDTKTLAALAIHQAIGNYLEFSTGYEVPDLLESIPLNRLNQDQDGELKTLYAQSIGKKKPKPIINQSPIQSLQYPKAQIKPKPDPWINNHIQTLLTINSPSEFRTFLDNAPHCPLKPTKDHKPYLGEGIINPQILILFEPSHTMDLSDPLIKLKGAFLEAIKKHRTLYHMEAGFWPLGNETLLSDEEKMTNRILLRRYSELIDPKAIFFVGGGAYELFEGQKPKISHLTEIRYDSSSGQRAHPIMATLGLKMMLAHPLSKAKVWRDFLSLHIKLRSDNHDNQLNKSE
jgi:hypothetical protein